MASPVVEKILEKPRKKRKTGENVIPILGVPCHAVSVFVRFLYSYRLVSFLFFFNHFLQLLLICFCFVRKFYFDLVDFVFSSDFTWHPCVGMMRQQSNDSKN
ncbi:unnamed protein product [Amaranthus hypochondriacus]